MYLAGFMRMKTELFGIIKRWVSTVNVQKKSKRTYSKTITLHSCILHFLQCYHRFAWLW